MRVLVVGGTPARRGGVEAFCERAVEALGRQPGWQPSHLPTQSAYLRPASLPAYLGGLVGLLRQRFGAARPDCVWLQYVNLPDLGYLLVARVLGLPVLVTPHLGSNWRSQSNPALRRLSRGLLGLARRIALLSATQVTEVDFPDSVPRSMIRTFLPRPLLEAPLPQPTPAAPLRLLHSARLSEGKGSFLFVELCRQLAQAGVAFEARITGSADEATSRRLREAIEGAGLGARLQWAGRADLDEQIARLGEADVLVHLSLVDSYPLIVLEALAFGAYPVCIDLAGARDMVQSYGGAVVPQASPLPPAVELLSRLDPVALRRDAVTLARRVREDYDWVACVEALVAAISAVASASRRN